jgi:2-polyprenyl-6-methoxyphenol hydroxylase-like FAD-dependent oxidoreductase
MYDAIVVGARCAGSPTAMLLARRGYRVLMLDRATFPSDTLSTHAVKLPAGAALQSWGLLDRVIASNCQPIQSWTIDVGPFALSGKAPPADGVTTAYAPRRRILDAILAEAAIEAGVEFRQEFSVDGLLFDGERVAGIRGHTAQNASITEAARMVIGADGMHSLVARSVDAPQYNVKPALTCAYFSYFSGVATTGVEFYPRSGCSIITFPTNDEQSIVLVQWPNAEFPVVRADIEHNFLRALNLAPGLAERVRSGNREDRFYGTADLPNYFRKPHGPGWALVGDAGLHRDPITAQGIVDAFRDSELLAVAFDNVLSGRQIETVAMADYEHQRNVAATPIYEFTTQQATLDSPPPEMQQLFAALRGNQPQIDRFCGLVEGTTSIPEYFTPENLRQIAAGAGAAIPA